MCTVFQEVKEEEEGEASQGNPKGTPCKHHTMFLGIYYLTYQ
jgi:hypothetical protein